VKMSAGGKPRDTAWRDLLASKGLSGAAHVLEEYGLSCENDMSILVQKDLNSLSRNSNPLVDGRCTVRLMRRVDWTC
jgi:hypothetical protein